MSQVEYEHKVSGLNSLLKHSTSDPIVIQLDIKLTKLKIFTNYINNFRNLPRADFLKAHKN